MQEAWRKYLGVALGVTETSRKKAGKVVQRLVGKGGATAEQLQTLTSDLLAAGSANREAIAKLVRFEVDRALGRVGLATADEVAQLTTRVRELEAELREARVGSGEPAVAAENNGKPAKKAVAKKAAAKAPGSAEPAHVVPPVEAPPVAAPPLDTSEAAEIQPAPAEKPAAGPAKKVAKKAPKKAQPKPEGA